MDFTEFEGRRAKDGGRGQESRIRNNRLDSATIGLEFGPELAMIVSELSSLTGPGTIAMCRGGSGQINNDLIR